MSLFSPADVEAAAKAIRDYRTAYETNEQFSLAKAQAALNAAVASLEGRGMMRMGAAYDADPDAAISKWTAYDETGVHPEEFPAAIVKLERHNP